MTKFSDKVSNWCPIRCWKFGGDILRICQIIANIPGGAKYAPAGRKLRTWWSLNQMFSSYDGSESTRLQNYYLKSTVVEKKAKYFQNIFPKRQQILMTAWASDAANLNKCSGVGVKAAWSAPTPTPGSLPRLQATPTPTPQTWLRFAQIWYNGPPRRADSANITHRVGFLVPYELQAL